mmetsp:Transcript_6446/g.26164  ORF Transcript_6446/g.26164 Transcript_6446/m.26164 type:complete len:228 (-) Transcript_6446:1073-1756(-)
MLARAFNGCVHGSACDSVDSSLASRTVHLPLLRVAIRNVRWCHHVIACRRCVGNARGRGRDCLAFPEGCVFRGAIGGSLIGKVWACVFCRDIHSTFGRRQSRGGWGCGILVTLLLLSLLLVDEFVELLHLGAHALHLVPEVLDGVATKHFDGRECTVAFGAPVRVHLDQQIPAPPLVAFEHEALLLLRLRRLQGAQVLPARIRRFDLNLRAPHLKFTHRARVHFVIT